MSPTISRCLRHWRRGGWQFAGHHALYEWLALQTLVVDDGGHVKTHQAQQQQLSQPFVVGGGQADGVAGNQRHQWPREGDFIVADQAGCHLSGKHTQHGEHRQSTQRVVSDRFGYVAPKVSQQAGRCGYKGAESRPVSTHDTPDHTKHQQTEHGVAKAHVPRHEIATDVAGDHEANHSRDQRPMEQAGRQIPYLDRTHDSDSIHQSERDCEPRNKPASW